MNEIIVVFQEKAEILIQTSSDIPIKDDIMKNSVLGALHARMITIQKIPSK